MALQHRRHGLQAQKNTRLVDAYMALKFFQRHLLQRQRPVDPSVVDQAAQGPQALGGMDRLLPLLGQGDIERLEHAARAQFAGQGLALLP